MCHYGRVSPRRHFPTYQSMQCLRLFHEFAHMLIKLIKKPPQIPISVLQHLITSEKSRVTLSQTISFS